MRTVSSKAIRRGIASVTTAVLTFSLIAAAPSSASPAIPQPEDVNSPPAELPFDDSQANLAGLKMWLLEDPSFRESGYIQTVNDATSGRARLLWHGDSPLQQKAKTEGAARGIEVSIESRQFSLEESTLGATKLAEAFEDIEKAAGFRIATVSAVEADFAGLTVKGSYPESDREGATGVQEYISRMTQLPVRVQLIQDFGAASNNVSRKIDYVPLHAGGFFPNGIGVCSSGFSLNVGSAAMTTVANHCSLPMKNQATGGDITTRRYGDEDNLPNGGQQNITRTRGTSSAFTGCLSCQSANDVTPVVGVYEPSIGDQICVSGGNSALRCGIAVQSTNATWFDGEVYASDMIEAVNPNGWASVQGDSGGPAFAAANCCTALAVGEIQGYEMTKIGSNTGAVCGPGNYIPSGIRCGNVAVISPIRQTVNRARSADPVSLTVAGAVNARTRLANGSWTSGGFATGSRLQAVAAASTPDGKTHFVSVDPNAREYYQSRSGGGAWSTITQVTGNQAVDRITDAALAATLDNYVQVMTIVDGRLRHQIRNPNGAWSNQSDVPNAPNGLDIVAVSGAGMPNGDTQWVSIDRGGNAYHQTRFYNGSWSAFTGMFGVGARAGNTAIAIAATFDGLSQVMAIANNGTEYHMVRRADGTWTTQSIVPGAPNRIAFVAAAGMSTGDAHFVVTTETGAEWHQIRSYPSGGWTSNPTGFTASGDVAVGGDSDQPSTSSLKGVTQYIRLAGGYPLP